MPKRLRKVLAALAPLACHLAEGFLRLLPDCRGCVGFGGWRQWWHRSTRTRKVPRVSRGNNAELCPLITSHITKLIEHTRLNKSHMLKQIINARKNITCSTHIPPFAMLKQKKNMLNTKITCSTQKNNMLNTQITTTPQKHQTLNHMLNTKITCSNSINAQNTRDSNKSHAQHKNHMLNTHPT